MTLVHDARRTNPEQPGQEQDEGSKANDPDRAYHPSTPLPLRRAPMLRARWRLEIA